MRKIYVDYIKAIGIILVVLGHLNFANSYYGIKAWIYSFHMPLFYFASGLVIKETAINRVYIFKKFKSLIMPFLIWGIIYSELTYRNIIYIVYGSYNTLALAHTLTSLWFLPVMFLGIIIVQFVFRLTHNIWIEVFFIIILAIVGSLAPKLTIGYPWCVDVSFLAATFLFFGYFIEKAIKKCSIYIMFSFMIIGFAGSQLFRLNIFEENSYVLMAKRYIGNPVLFYVVAISGCIMTYGLARLLASINCDFKILNFLGKNTLAIFAVHKPIIKVLEKFFSIHSYPWFVELLFSLILVLFVSSILARLINKFIPMLNGKQ